MRHGNKMRRRLPLTYVVAAIKSHHHAGLLRDDSSEATGIKPIAMK